MSEAREHQGKLALVGASVRAAAQSALRGGYDPTAFDFFADADLTAICEAVRLEQFNDRLVELLRNSTCDAWLYTGGMENQAELVTRLASVRQLLGCNAEVLAKVRSPQWLSASLLASGYEYPEIRQQPPGSPGEGWLRKRIQSGGGLDVGWAVGRVGTAHHELPISHASVGNAHPTVTSEYYYQRYVAGEPISAMYLADGERCTLLALFQQWIGQPWTGASSEFLYCGALGPLVVAEPIRAELQGIGQHLTCASGLCGLFGIDALLSENRATLLEVNPRYTASMQLWERSTGQSLIDLHCRACRGMPVSVEPISTKELLAQAIIYATKSTRIGTRFQSHVEQVNRRGWQTIADIPHVDQRIERGEPICSLFARGTHTGDLERDMHRLAEQLRQQLDS